MTSSKSGERARASFYFDPRTWGMELHRKDDERYVPIPTVWLLVLGPLIGVLFVILLPFIRFALSALEFGHRAACWFVRKTGAAAKAMGAAR